MSPRAFPAVSPDDPLAARAAVLANLAAYAEAAGADYVDGAPHLKHRELRELFASLLEAVYRRAARRVPTPHVLDLGAGEGSCTLPFLELGARVTAVDLSAAQLAALRTRCTRFEQRLDVRCADALAVLAEEGPGYDVVALSSFLHHVPDYLGLLDGVVGVLRPGGEIFSFEDPLRYDSLGSGERLFSQLAYASWRIFRGDVIGGLRRRARRRRGVYLADSPHDNAEFHVTRNGVDQDAVRELLASHGLECDLVTYFATQSSIFQPLGTALGVRNSFALLARRSA